MTQAARATATLALVAGALAVPSTAAAATKTVYAGPPVKPPAGTPRDFETNDFYRRTVTVRRGDSVSWAVRGFHNILFPGGATAPPFVEPDPSAPIVAHDSTGAPFWFNGSPSLVVNPAVAFPAGPRQQDGSAQTNSGLPLGPSRPYALRFPKTGTYSYLCTVHPDMRGRVRVVRASRSVPSAAADRAAARAQLARTLRRAREAARTRVRESRVVRVGVDGPGYALLRFVPRSLSVRVGDVVSFNMYEGSPEAHTVTFGRAASLKRLGDNIVGPRPGTERQTPPVIQFDPIGALPSDPGAVFDHTGANHGTGFLNSGLVDADAASPQPAASRIRFTRAGTFRYVCLLHEAMKGTIRVRP